MEQGLDIIFRRLPGDGDIVGRDLTDDAARLAQSKALSECL